MEPPPDATNPEDHPADGKGAAFVVSFVGAGPGAADLLTVRATRVLRQADVVVYDQLVHPQVLEDLCGSARLLPVCRESVAQNAMDAGSATGHRLVELAVAGHRVVRLKGGDPTIFARLAEEMRPLVEAGIAVDIIPGVTAATAAAAAAGIPLTSRSSSSSVTLVTGHQAGVDRAGMNGESIDLGMLARVSGTLAFYMGVERIDEWTSRLVAAGCPADTPVAIVSRCGWPEQRIIETSLADAADAAAREDTASPAVAIVGGVVREGRLAAGRGSVALGRAGLSEEPLPLEGRRILLVRARGQSEELSRSLRSCGAECVEAPAIRIGPPDSWEPLDDAIDRAWSFDWMVFSSANGVRAFVNRLRSRRLDARILGSVRLAAVGPRTAAELEAAGLACDLVPTAAFDAEALAALLLQGPARRRFLLMRADRGRETLAEQLVADGHVVTEVVAYTSRDVESVDPAAMADLRQRPADWIVLTSAAVAASAARLFGELLPRMRIASISGRTSEVLRGLGFPPTVEADVPTSAAIVGAVCGYERAARRRESPVRP